MIENMLASSLHRLSKFKTEGEAYERRGEVSGIEMIQKVIEEIPLYNEIEEEINVSTEHRSYEERREADSDKYDRAAGF
jgi:hypothetical protein